MKKMYLLLLAGTIAINVSIYYGQNVGDVIITEIIQNPDAVSDANGEWFELYNTTDLNIDIEGWEIKDSGSNSHIISESLVIPAKGFAVLGKNSDINSNGGVSLNYAYESGMTLNNTSDDIILVATNDVIIDEVSWDNGATFPKPTGKSMSLKVDQLDYLSNDDGANWEEATTTYGDGDFGTPGVLISQVLATSNNEVYVLSVFPNPVTYGNVEIITNGRGNKELTIFNVLGKMVCSKIFTGTRHIINTSRFNSGVYLLKIVEDDKLSTTRLVIN